MPHRYTAFVIIIIKTRYFGKQDKMTVRYTTFVIIIHDTKARHFGKQNKMPLRNNLSNNYKWQKREDTRQDASQIQKPLRHNILVNKTHSNL